MKLTNCVGIISLLLYRHPTCLLYKTPSLVQRISTMATKRSFATDHTDKTNVKKQKETTSTTTKNLPFVPKDFNPARARLLTSRNNQVLNQSGKCVVLWMSRDQRAVDNHALYYAQALALEHHIPLKVVFNLVPKFLEATLRQYSFMLRGLEEVEQTLRAYGIPLHLLKGDPVHTLPTFALQHEAMALVTDFSPLRVGLGWAKEIAATLDESPTAAGSLVPLVQVDAHNVVPCWEASPKQEYGARTIRSKIQARLAEFLTPQPALQHNPANSLDCEAIDWAAALEELQINRSIGEVGWIDPGTTAGYRMVDTFIEHKIKQYADKRNDPNEDVLSNLSPYLHFGQISAQAAVLRVKASGRAHGGGMDAFVEEAVVRRELSDNFCYYNHANYDSLQGLSGWARETLALHANDHRQHVYTLAQLEQAQTHDDLWNAAQLQMVTEGKMHGFLRMYWAKKILEWTDSPAQALQWTILLNDRYQLDGRDPNGYVGCMWSIGGIHDQGWGERPVFGKIRFMNYKGCQRKFDVKKFVAKYPPAAANAQATGIPPY